MGTHLFKPEFKQTTKIIMKSFIASAILAGIAQAGFSDMKADFSNMVNRYVRGLMESGTPVDRAISDILTGDNFDRINEYACWCYFELPRTRSRQTIERNRSYL